jgi:TolB protein
MVLAALHASAADQRIAFERDNGIYIANSNVSLVRKLTDGICPAISPDGKRVVFTMMATNNGPHPHPLATIVIATAATHQFDSIAGDTSHPAWSPDVNQLAFVLQAGDSWHLGVIKADGTDFRELNKTEHDQEPLYSPCWAGDGASIFCHDLTNIYRIALDGSIVNQWPISRLTPNGAMSAGDRIDVSPDGKRLLLSVEMDEEYSRADWEGPVPALWSFDLATDVAVRLTSKDLFAWDGCWLDNTNILFVSQPAGAKKPAIYRTNGKILKRLIDNARRPSVSAK